MQILVPLLTVLFVGLKLTGYIAWSWWWVLSPLWIGFIVSFVLMLILLGCRGALETWVDRRDRRSQ
jgi:hypothetical protein